jgi:peptidoglycan/xylan/chitin deacetylase (PgdA/CDA1 family)
VRRKIEIVSPHGRAWVSRDVSVIARTKGLSAGVAFEVSLDGGRTWAPVDADVVEGRKGWRARWDSRRLNGPAGLRATRVGEPVASDVVKVRVDNRRPSLRVSTQPAFSPNGDGRKDVLPVQLRTNEPTKARITVARKGTRYARVTFPMSGDERRTIHWDGTTSEPVPDGGYSMKVRVTDRAGLTQQRSIRVIVDRRAPNVRIREVAPLPRPHSRSVHLRYEARDRDEVLRSTLRVRDLVGSIQTKRKKHGRGNRSFEFRTRYRNGDPLYPGRYEAEVFVADRAGNVASVAYGWNVHRRLPGRVYTSLPKAGSKVALTFDDCHFDDAWASILDTLEAYREKATFFCPGERFATFPELAARTVREGHIAGSHGWDHADLSAQSYSGVYYRLMNDRRAWLRFGTTSAPYFRPPGGAYDSTVVAAAGDTSHPRVVNWDVDSGDTKGASGSSLVCNVVCNSDRGSIILLHTLDHTADVLPEIIEGLRDRGLEPVTLPELFRAAGHR